ncbi:hypothetical protein FRB99_004935 [Tulasnella sp. 403]|nr:hypothetical protein FRB99_004935 [Tulasnella sp. 403]
MSTVLPRPILKSSIRKSSTSSCDSDGGSPPARTPCVQFSPCISTTYLTHGSMDYNRSPITVTPNSCALPKRGCPGRTYRDELAQFRREAEGRELPALVSDDGCSSSEESDASLPPIPAYTIPTSLLKSKSRSSASSSRRTSKPSTYSSYSSSYSISRPAFEFDGRDDIFGGF